MSKKSTSKIEYEEFSLLRGCKRIADFNAKKIVQFQNSKPCENPLLNELQNHLKTVFTLLQKERDKGYNYVDPDDYGHGHSFSVWFDHYYEHPLNPVLELFKTSSLIPIMGLREDFLNTIYSYLESNFPQPIKKEDIGGRGSIVIKFKSYLKQYGEISPKLLQTWAEILHIYKIRNIIAHGGIIELDNEKLPKNKNVFKAIKKHESIAWDENGKIKIEDDFYSSVFETIDTFFKLLTDELDIFFKKGHLPSPMSPYP
jgi:hypothetical protein